MIDTHCHLNDVEAFPEPSIPIQEALAAGVEQLIVVGIDHDWSVKAVELAEQFEPVFAVVGHHPNCAATFSEALVDEYRRLFAHPKTVAIGEIGFDFHWQYATLAQQQSAFESQLNLAVELGAPVVLHVREAYDQTLEFLSARTANPPLLFHCFAGNAEHADRAVQLGAYFGVDGPITFKAAHELRTIVSGLPKDRIVIETDAPWLAPHPHRGKRNSPALLRLVLEGLASTLGITAKEAEKVTTENAFRFFPKLASALASNSR